jgi:hypothetical protein
MKNIRLILFSLKFLLFSLSSFTQTYFSGLTIYCYNKYDSLTISKMKYKNDTIYSNGKFVYDDKFIRYLKKLQRQTINYSCTSSIFEYPGIYELPPNKFDYTIFQIIFFKDDYCNIIRYEKEDLIMYAKIDFRFIFILNTVNKIKKRCSQILQDKL